MKTWVIPFSRSDNGYFIFFGPAFDSFQRDCIGAEAVHHSWKALKQL